MLCDFIGDYVELRPPPAPHWLARELSDLFPDLWSLSGRWREDDVTIFELTYDRHGPAKRVIEVEQRGCDFRVVSDLARPGYGGKPAD